MSKGLAYAAILQSERLLLIAKGQWLSKHTIRHTLRIQTGLIASPNTLVVLGEPIESTAIFVKDQGVDHTLVVCVSRKSLFRVFVAAHMLFRPLAKVLLALRRALRTHGTRNTSLCASRN